MLSKTLLLLSTMSLSIASPTAQVQTDADQFLANSTPGTFAQISSAGNGCPGRRLKIVADQGSQTLAVYPAESLDARIGNGTDPMEKQKACTVTAQVQYSAGLQFSVVPSDWTGFASLDNGVQGTFIETMYFTSNPENTVSIRQPISGPDYQNGSKFSIPSSVLTPDNLWSQCGGDDIFSVKYRIALNGDSGSGEIKEFEDGDPSAPHHTFKLVWRSC